MSAPTLPATVTRSCAPVDRSMANSISETPEPSAVAPGANEPPLRSMLTVSDPVLPETTIVLVVAVVAVPHWAAPNMIRPAFAPVPTAIEAVSPAALMLTVAVPAANAQLTAPSAGAGAATTAATVASNAIQRQGRIILGDESALAARDPSCRERGRPDTGSKTTFHDDARSPVARAPSARKGMPIRSMRGDSPCPPARRPLQASDASISATFA